MLCTLATPFSCWVIPIAQAQIIRSDASAIVGALRDQLARHAALLDDHVPRRGVEIAHQRLEPLGVMRDEVVRQQLAARRAIRLQHLLHQALEQRDVAVDPHGQEQARRSASPCPSSDSGSCGFLNRIIPVSGSGLTLTILQPFFAAFCSSVSMRGWQVPGFWPMMKMLSA